MSNLTVLQRPQRRRCERRKSAVAVAAAVVHLLSIVPSFPFTTAFVALPRTGTTSTGGGRALSFAHRNRWRRNAVDHHRTTTTTPATSGYVGSGNSRSGTNASLLLATASPPTAVPPPPPPSVKETFLRSLDRQDRLNDADRVRTDLLNTMVGSAVPTDLRSLLRTPPATAAAAETPTQSVRDPARTGSYSPLAPGTWKVVYAPHMTTMARIAGGGEFRVEYILNGDGTMQSHARLEFPWMGLAGVECVYLSVSGTYGSVDDTVCRVDFDKAWIRSIPLSTASGPSPLDDGPYPFLSDVPDSPARDAITALGNLFFVDSVSVFPVSFLDRDLIVFDFELLGTRICARKVGFDGAGGGGGGGV